MIGLKNNDTIFFLQERLSFCYCWNSKSESKEISLEILKTMIKNTEEIKEVSDLNIFGKTL